MEKFEVKTEKFEGPLDLLLDLIEKRKLHISDISLASIADDYISYIEQRQPFPMESASQFIIISATLLLIKSRSLLPSLKLTDEEERDVAELELRLKIYKEIKRISEEISARYGKQVLYPTAPMQREVSFSPGTLITPFAMRTSVHDVLKKLPSKEKEPEARVKKIISLEEMIERLRKRIEGALQMTFKEFVGKDKSEKIEIVVSFLAMLELVKQGIIEASQERRFGDINLHKEEVSMPRYE